MGFVHIYYGNGKGKTTAAVGLAVRANGYGLPVLFLQFMKDGRSAELRNLEKLGIEVLSGQPEGAEGFTWELDEAGLEARKAWQNERLGEAFAWLEKHPGKGLLVLDEALSSINYGLLDEGLVIRLMDQVKGMEPALDLVLTGRDPSTELLARADYLSEVLAVRHPFEKGILAREGIEY